MPEKSYFSYVRVLTQRQGQQGTSLAEQTAAIDRFAQHWNLPISKRYEERETAAKTGRPVFLDMLKELKQGKAHGLVIHKIDRSARNLKDWAELGSLIDLGIEVHFANESLDLSSRGGRLSADIQAVVASDFIRNLREETKKGIYGRVKQGLYPFPAPVGYINMGQGQPKRVDPINAPLVKTAFELYASGNWSIDGLLTETYKLGLRNKNGNKMSKSGFLDCLRNPFYIGLVKIRSMGEMFVGQHEPIISKDLFDDVQNVLTGKSVKKKTKHFFIFRQHIRCGNCQYAFIPERQKGNVYYRCHTKQCPQPPIREELIEAQLMETLSRLEFSKREIELMAVELDRCSDNEKARVKSARKQLALQADQYEARIEKLADAYMDGIFDKETYLLKKNKLTLENSDIKRELENNGTDLSNAVAKTEQFLELLKWPYLSYKLGNEYERRDLMKIATSNFIAEGKGSQLS